MSDDRDEARKPDTMEADVETRQLTAALAEFGVDELRLKNDVRRNFLPRPRIESTADGRPRVGYWSATAVRRARLLYKLRQRGAKGEMLRLLLFLEDGWGWQHVRETCLEGVRRGTAASLSGLARYAPRGAPDDFAVDQIIAHQHATLVSTVGEVEGMRPTSEPMTRFYLGVLRDGAPLDGGSAKSVIEPMNRLFFPEASDEEIATGSWTFDILATMLDLRPARLQMLLESAGEEQVERGRREVFVNFTHIANAIRRQNGEEPVVSLVDARTVWESLADIPPREFAKNPAGLTLAQALGSIVAMTIALDAAMRELAATAESFIPLLPVLMRMGPGLTA
jgi:hypothetical protein